MCVLDMTRQKYSKTNSLKPSVCFCCNRSYNVIFQLLLDFVGLLNCENGSMANIRKTVFIVLGLVLHKFLMVLPLLGWLTDWLERKLEAASDQNFKFLHRDFDWGLIPAITLGLTNDRGRQAYPGGLAPNAKLVFLDRTRCHLYNFLHPRPLVLSFVSHVDEPFFSELKNFNDMARRMSWMADFLTVVVGCGVWRSKNDLQQVLDVTPNTCTKHHYCMQDRKTVAAFLVDSGILGDIVYDTPSNEADIKYGGNPERLYIIYRHAVIYAGKRGGSQSGYNVSEVWRCLWVLNRKLYKSQAYNASTYREQQVNQYTPDDPHNPLNVHKLPKGAFLSSDLSLESELMMESNIDTMLTLQPAKGIIKTPSPAVVVASESTSNLDINSTANKPTPVKHTSTHMREHVAKQASVDLDTEGSENEGNVEIQPTVPNVPNVPSAREAEFGSLYMVARGKQMLKRLKRNEAITGAAPQVQFSGRPPPSPGGTATSDPTPSPACYLPNPLGLNLLEESRSVVFSDVGETLLPGGAIRGVNAIQTLVQTRGPNVQTLLEDSGMANSFDDEPTPKRFKLSAPLDYLRKRQT